MTAFIIKFFYPRKSKRFALFAICVVTVFTIAAHFSMVRYTSLQVVFVVNTEDATDFDIYYDIGRGLTENDHRSQKIEKTHQDVIVHFCIPVYNRFKFLRFDPGTKRVKMTIKHIYYSYDFGKTLEIPLASVQPLNQIESSSIVNEELQFTTAVDGNDPNFVITSNLTPPEKTQMESVILYTQYIFIGLMVSLFLRFIVLFFIKGL